MVSAFTRAHLPAQKILEGVRLAFLVFNLVGFIVYPLELTLLGHWLSPGSWIPLFASVLGFVFTALILIDRKTPWIYSGFVATMVLLAATGLLGFAYHLVYNFEGKIDWRFLSTVKALEGARPALAPLAFTHIGLTGLLCAYRAR